jgi:hypothetical protein
MMKELEAKDAGALTIIPIGSQSCFAEDSRSLAAVPVLLTRDKRGGGSHGRKHRQESAEVVHLVDDGILSSRVNQVI